MSEPSAIRPRAFRALLLVATLLLGVAAHAWHHVVDPGCDDTPGPLSHVCATCSALHAAPLAAEGATCASPAPVPYADASAPALDAPATRAISRAAPRAPPTA